MCIGCFLISYVLRKRILASGNLPPQRRQVVVRGVERASALWRDELSDGKHEEMHRLSSNLIEKNPTVFEPPLFSTNSVGVQSLQCITSKPFQSPQFCLEVAAPLPENAASSVSTFFDKTGNSYASAAKQTFSFCQLETTIYKYYYTVKPLDPSKRVKLQLRPIQKRHLHILVLCRPDLWSRSLRFTFTILLFNVQSWCRT